MQIVFVKVATCQGTHFKGDKVIRIKYLDLRTRLALLMKWNHKGMSRDGC